MSNQFDLTALNWFGLMRDFLNATVELHKENFHTRDAIYLSIATAIQKQQDVWIEAQRRWLDAIFPK